MQRRQPKNFGVVFKGTPALKKWNEGEPLDLKPTRNKFLYRYNLTKLLLHILIKGRMSELENLGNFEFTSTLN
jgi:hypothetical protein